MEKKPVNQFPNQATNTNQLNGQRSPRDIHDLFKNWQDDGIRDSGLDWGQPVGNELKR
ncbi:hypothetical protein [Lactiplantibacillus plajomi]|uniref:Uncharacterized protein n=1 Tax=Lactiplantibacillus plajomi TaxID=1457217 RepID=A0ABV6K1C4_9LACO|nr:hypothetical protein [Lactiplantibacillus plajomi]